MKNLEFDEADIYTDDVENQISYNPATGIECFSIMNTDLSLGLASNGRLSLRGDQGLGNAIRKWIIYVGIKYHQLRNSCLNWEVNSYRTGLIEEKHMMITSLAATLTKLKHLEKFSLTSAVIYRQYLVANGVQLKHFGLY